MIRQEQAVEPALECREGIAGDPNVVFLEHDVALALGILGRDLEAPQPVGIEGEQLLDIRLGGIPLREPVDVAGGAIRGPSVGGAVGKEPERGLGMVGIAAHQQEVLQIMGDAAAPHLGLVGAARPDHHRELDRAHGGIAHEHHPVADPNLGGPGLGCIPLEGRRLGRREVDGTCVLLRLGRPREGCRNGKETAESPEVTHGRGMTRKTRRFFD
jgi:hypothetical protein